MADLTTYQVNVGVNPNDGTGNNIRDAFIKTNQNITAITEFLTLGPMLSNLVVSNSITASSVSANTGLFSNLHVSATTISTSPVTGALTVAGGVGVVGNVNVGGTIYGDIEGDVVTASSLGVNGGSILRGNVITGSLSVGTDLDKKDLVVSRNAEIWGELTVHGNVITISTSVFDVESPVIKLGKAANVDLSSNDGKDRGVEFFWFDDVAASQQEGFFGFQNTSQKLIYIPRSHYAGSNDDDIFLGDYGDARFNEVEANIVSSGTSTFSNVQTSTINVTSGIVGTLLTNAQPNINSVGTLSNLTVGGSVTVNSGNVYVTGGSLYINGSPVSTSAETFHGGTVSLDTIFISNTASTTVNTGTVRVVGGVGVTGNVNVGDTISVTTVTATSVEGTLTTGDQPNITSVGTLGNLDVSGSLSSYSASAHHATYSTYVNADTVGGTLTTAAQPNITSVGNLTSLSMTGDIITAGNIRINNNVSELSVGDSIWMSNGAVEAPSFNGSFYGLFNGAITFPDLTVQTTAYTGGGGGPSEPSDSANTPNTLVLRDANGDFSAGVITAIVTNARYADLAEKYKSDAQYQPGTVLVFGGSMEVTITTKMADVSVAGVVSTAPAYVMNHEETDAVTVALRGKVPVKVVGPVRKGDLLVTSDVPGHAISVGKSSAHSSAVFGKSLEEDLSVGIKTINAVII